MLEHWIANIHRKQPAATLETVPTHPTRFFVVSTPRRTRKQHLAILWEAWFRNFNPDGLDRYRQVPPLPSRIYWSKVPHSFGLIGGWGRDPKHEQKEPYRSRWLFQIRPQDGIPALSLVLDDTAKHTAHQTALHLWTNHARAHGYTGPAPRTLPRGTVKRYVGTTRHAPPLDEVPPPRLLVEPYTPKPRARRRTKAEMVAARAAARAQAAAKPVDRQRVK